MSEKYTERLFVKVRPSEKQRIQTRAKLAGMSLSDFLRHTAVTSIIRPRRDYERLIRAVNAVGNNLNQLVKHCNAHSYDPFSRPIAISAYHIEEMLRRLVSHIEKRG
ncbi:plasmid mobilization protein [Sneathiella glossodoripedis]|uniref:plasmid mobilization protein n=1 Tax=Sneathiella glossodoripedis TaxID=418853 RepID=UPI00046E6A14|nr:plasmid mobilization relaxosome protein MobC [Sneathiella glossodoripedis]